VDDARKIQARTTKATPDHPSNLGGDELDLSFVGSL
jgi:hypothetical protein